MAYKSKAMQNWAGENQPSSVENKEYKSSAMRNYEANMAKKAHQEEEARQQELIAQQEAEAPRRATLKDLTLGSVKKGYAGQKYNVQHYDEVMLNTDRQAKQAERAKEKLEQEKYNFEAQSGLGRTISGAGEILGQQVYNAQRAIIPTLATGAAAGFATGGLGTLPAAGKAFQISTGISDGKAMAASAYDEMREAGVSEGNAKIIANAIGGSAAALGATISKQLMGSTKLITEMQGEAAEKAAKELIEEMTEKGWLKKVADVASKPAVKAVGKLAGETAKETAEEVAQETISMVGQDYAKKKEGIDTFTADEYKQRLGDTAVQSALTFGLLGGVGAVGGAMMNRNNIKAQTNEANTEESEAENTSNEAKVGKATTIKSVYEGDKPTYTKPQNRIVPEISQKSVDIATQQIEEAKAKSAAEGGSLRGYLKNFYNAVFDEKGGKRDIKVNGVTFENGDYLVTLGKKSVGKAVSDPNLTAEKLSIFDNIDNVIANAEYVGSGKYDQHSAKQKNVTRYDYFETDVTINGKPYLVTFDVEVYPNTNNYRTHKVINKINLTDLSAADVGPVPTATDKQSSLSINTISQNNANINGNILQENAADVSAITAVENRYGDKGINALRLLSNVNDSKLAEFDRYYRAGTANQQRPADSNILSKNEATAAYMAGMADAKANKEAYANKKVAINKKAGLDMSSATHLTLRERITWDRFAKALGVRISFADTSGDVNAKYNMATGEIIIARDATNFDTVLVHEIVHRLRQTSPNEFYELSKSVLELLESQGRLEGAMSEYSDLYGLNEGNIEYFDTMEEIVADFMANEVSTEELINMVNAKPSVAEKLLKIIEDVIKNLADLNDAELKQTKANLQDLHDKMKKAVNASENAVKATEQKVKETKYPADAKIGDDSFVVSEVRESRKSATYDIEQDEMRQDLVKYGIFTEEESHQFINNLSALIDNVITPNASILDMNEDFDRDDRKNISYKPNSDSLYKVSLDFSTLCKKRLMSQYVTEQLQLRLGRAITNKEQLAIRDRLLELKKENDSIEVACALCYVEAARLKSPVQINRFLKDRTGYMTKYFAKANKEFDAKVKQLQIDMKVEKGYDADATISKLPQKDKNAINDATRKMRMAYKPSAEEMAVIDIANSLDDRAFLTLGNLEKLAEEQPDIYKAFAGHVASSTRSKELQGNTAYYYGDSRREGVSDALIALMNAENGLRHQSWSDFQSIHLLDTIVAIAELSTRKAKMQAYTKVPNFVKLVGRTGMMINLSLIPDGRTGFINGQLAFSNIEGMDFETAKKLRDTYANTTGTIAIGINDQQIKALLVSGEIDYVIPYHASGLNKELRRIVKLESWDDYQNKQSEKKIEGYANIRNNPDWHKKPDFSEWFKADEIDTTKDGVTIMREAAERYKQLCLERGLKPKFDDFKNEPNYWKLLIDRKMVDHKTGKIIMQETVRPVFDFDVITEMLNEEVQSYDANLNERLMDTLVGFYGDGGKNSEISQRIKQLDKEGKAREAAKKKGVYEAYEQFPMIDVAVAGDVRESRKSTDRDVHSVDTYTEKTYAEYGWAYLNYDETGEYIWTAYENKIAEEMFRRAKAQSKQMYYGVQKMLDGGYAALVGNKVVIKKGDAITEIVKFINVDDVDEAEMGRGFIYETGYADADTAREIVGSMFREGVIFTYTLEDSKTYWEISEEAGRDSSAESDRYSKKYNERTGNNQGGTGSLSRESRKSEPTIPDGYKERGFNESVRTKTDYDDIVQQEFIDNPEIYKQLANKVTKEKAKAIMDKGLAFAETEFPKLLERMDATAIALGDMMAREYSNMGEYDKAVTVIRDMAKQLTKAGQFSQAAVIALTKSNPMTALAYAKRDIDKLNADGHKTFGKKWKNFELTAEEEEMFKNIKQGDADAIKAAYEKINKRIAKEYPSTIWQKFIEASRISMLLNPRTNAKNIASNMLLRPITRTSGIVSAGIQKAYKYFNNDYTPTQAVTVRKETKKLAEDIWNNIKDTLDTTSKYNEGIKANKRDVVVFKEGVGTRVMENIAPGTLHKLNTLMNTDDAGLMETLRHATYWFLEMGDNRYVRKNFLDRLGSYLEAQGIREITEANQETIDTAVQVAYREAMRATFKDDTALSKWMASIKHTGNPYIDAMMEMIMPFTKTPANIAMRGIDYSPIGVINTINKYKKNKDMGELFDELGKNGLGTALILLGALLFSKGIVTGGEPENEKEAAFLKQQGWLPYAVKVGDSYTTYDWAQPAAIPIIMGVTIMESFEEGRLGVVDAVKNAGVASFNQWVELSPLQSLKEVMGGYGTVGENLLNTAIEMPQRLIPSALGATARTADTTQRLTYSKGNVAQTQKDLAKSKLPGLSQTLPAAYDTWGNVKKRDNNTGVAAINQFINPASYKRSNATEVDREIERLYESLGDEAVYPRKAEYSIKKDGKTYELNNREYSEYQRIMGQLSYDNVKALMDNAAYDSLTDYEKGKIIEKIYSNAFETAKYAVLEGKGYEKTDADIKDMQETKIKQAYLDYNANNIAEYYIAHQILNNADSDKTANGTTIAGSKKKNGINRLVELGFTRGEARRLHDRLKG